MAFGHAFELVPDELILHPCKGVSVGCISESPCPSVHYYTPASTKLKGGYTGFTLSVCPSVDRIVSALYFQQYSSDPFHICTSYQATSEGVSCVMPVSKFKNLKFWRIFLICNFDFVFFWLGIQYDSMVWVIIRRQGVSSEPGVLVVLVLCVSSVVPTALGGFPSYLAQMITGMRDHFTVLVVNYGISNTVVLEIP